MSSSKKWRVALGIVFCAVMVVIASSYAARSSAAWQSIGGSQEVRSLDRRISSLELRLYSIETSINRLEQSAISARTPNSQPAARDQEITLLRTEIQTLQQRLNEIECGLVKLDERTTTAAAREARREAAKLTDPCRQNPLTPVRLSTRP